MSNKTAEKLTSPKLSERFWFLAWLLPLDFQFNQLHDLNHTSLIENFKAILKVNTPMLLTSTAEYHKDLF